MTRTVTLTAATLLVLSACNQSGSEATAAAELTAVPDPHPITCDLAAEVAVVVDDIEVTVEALGGQWQIALEETDTGGAYSDEALRIAVEAAVVGAADPWGLDVEEAALSIVNQLRGMVVDRGVVESIPLPASYDVLVSRCP